MNNQKTLKQVAFSFFLLMFISACGSASSGTSTSSIPPLPTLSINDVSLTEGNAGTVNAVFTVTLSQTSTTPVTVDFATGDGTALSGSDYLTTSGVLNFPSASTSQTVSVVVNGDTLVEADETFFVNLSNPANTSLPDPTLLDAQGLGTILNDDAPTLNNLSVRVLSTGSRHSCALQTDGRIKCWGVNDFGQLGNPTILAGSPSPVLVSEINTAIAISGGTGHTCALLSEGTVRCWGGNFFGQIGEGGANFVSPTPVQVSGITSAAFVSAGNEHSCASLSDGTVRCWGRNQAGQLGNGITTDSRVPVQVEGITTATAVAAGSFHSCAVLSDGKVMCWGANFVEGLLGNNSTTTSLSPVEVSGITSATAVSASFTHSCALLSDGTVMCWGSNNFGQIGNGSTTNSLIPVLVSDITSATAISAGVEYNCAVLLDGRVKCWGRNPSGQLGNGTTTASTTPVFVSGITNATAVSAGIDHSCTFLSDRNVKCWGFNNSGQLGNGIESDFLDFLTPVDVGIIP